MASKHENNLNKSVIILDKLKMNRLRDETAFNSSTNSARLAEASHLNFRDLNQKAPDGKFNQARSPIPSTQYLGISTHNIQQSTHSVNTSNYIVKKSSEIVTHSSVKFKNSEDILAYLREHPQFQKLKNDRLDGIVAAIISGLSIAGGVAVIVVSGGTATPTVMLSSSLFISAGTSGLQNAINGLVIYLYLGANGSKHVVLILESLMKILIGLIGQKGQPQAVV